MKKLEAIDNSIASSMGSIWMKAVNPFCCWKKHLFKTTIYQLDTTIKLRITKDTHKKILRIYEVNYSIKYFKKVSADLKPCTKIWWRVQKVYNSNW